MPAKKKEAPHQVSPDIARIVSLGKGTFAYVFDQHGKLHHVKRNSDEMIRVCKETDEVLNGRVKAQLIEMGWTDVVERLEADSVEADSGDA
jgi:hypothetical protein